MGQYLSRRFLHSLFSLAGLIVLVFFLARLTGDPTNLYLPLDASLQARADFAEKHGFNDPRIEQFGRFLEGLSRFDLGDSVRKARPAIEVVLETFPNAPARRDHYDRRGSARRSGRRAGRVPAVGHGPYCSSLRQRAARDLRVGVSTVRRVLGTACGEQPRPLWTDQGERARAHGLLAPVYGCFSEGFDTADLRGAKALLDELA